MNGNQTVTKQEAEAIRALDDFDLIMLISEIHDHGWPFARHTLAIIPKAKDTLKDSNHAD